MEIGLYSSNASTSGQGRICEGEEQALRWAALERLPTNDRARKRIFQCVNGELKEVDLQKLGYEEREELFDRLIKSADNNEQFLQKLEFFMHIRLGQVTFMESFKSFHVGRAIHNELSNTFESSKFFLNLFFIFITILYNIYYGMMVVAVSPSHEIAILCTSILNTKWNLFSSFVIPRTIETLISFTSSSTPSTDRLIDKLQQIMVWLRWYSWICSISWSLYRMASLQYADVEKNLDTGETVEEFMKDYFGFEYEMLWVVSMALMGFTLLFALIYMPATRRS